MKNRQTLTVQRFYVYQDVTLDTANQRLFAKVHGLHDMATLVHVHTRFYTVKVTTFALISIYSIEHQTRQKVYSWKIPTFLFG